MSSSSTSSIFSGSSRYSSDFQAVVDRAVAITSLSLTALTRQKETLSAQSSALQSLNTVFDSLQSSIANLSTATGLSSYSTAVSDGTIVSASLSSSAAEGAYTIEVTGLGSYTSTTSKTGLLKVTDPASQNISAASAFTVTVDGNSKQITPSTNTLNALVEAINSDTSLNVRASIVNLGSTSSPDYRLALQSTKLGPVGIQLNDGSQDLQNTQVTGALATYKVNGIATEISSDSRTVTLAPGLTLQLLKQSTSGVQTTVTVSRSSSAVSNALSSFVTAYNTATEQLTKHRGEAGGALGGQSIITSLSQAMRELVFYSGGSGAATSMMDLGLTFDDQGKLSFDGTKLSSIALGDLVSFLGDATQSGFLKNATDTMNGLTDSTSGLLDTSISSIQSQLTAQDARISTEQERVDNYRKDTERRMAQADALIASIEQQVLYVNGLFQAYLDSRRSNS
jgi:flagellar hook-associated protein 2